MGKPGFLPPEKLGRKMVVNCKVAVDVGCITDRSVPEIENQRRGGTICKETLCLCLGYIVSVYCMHIV